MAGATNTGVAGYISNPVARFPKNSITVDIFGNTFYRDYAFGAGDDTGVYWNDNTAYSKGCMLFFAVAMGRSLAGKFSYGNKLRSSQSLDMKMQLPINNGKIDFEFIDRFIAELQAQRIAELQAYLTAAGLKDYTLTKEEHRALEEYSKLRFCDFNISNVFLIKNAGNILSENIVENSGTIPYLCASAENNAVSSYISYDKSCLDNGNCIFIGGKTFKVTYQENDFYSNDSHNLILRLLDEGFRTKDVQLYIATCVKKSLKHKYSWGCSVSSTKIKKETISLPARKGKIDYASMSTLISAIQKLVIKDVVQYADRNINATESIVHSSAYKVEEGDHYDIAAEPVEY